MDAHYQTVTVEEKQAALEKVIALAEFSPEGILLRANDSYLSLLGYRQDNAIGMHHRQFCPTLFRQSSQYDEFWRELLSGMTHTGKIERLRYDGTICWLEATYVPIFDDQGNVLEVMKIAMDVSERTQQEIMQEKHLRRLSIVADASDSAIMISDADSHIVYVNAGFNRMFGWSCDEMSEQKPHSLLVNYQSQTYTKNYTETLRAGYSLSREEMVQGKEGQRYWAKIVSNPVMDGDGNWLLTVSILTDITHVKMYEVLQQHALEAMARDRSLTDVLELICHEVERIAPEVLASILEVDEDGVLHPLAAPSLPAGYCEALNGIVIGPKVGSCGTAAWRNEPVLVDDIANDPLWADYRDLVLPLGLTGCWSTPICNGQGTVIGTFAFYFMSSRNPHATAFHKRLVEACTYLCMLALEREHTQCRIRQLAFYDALTGLPNRRLLQARADQAIVSARCNGEQLAVLFVDLDRFKQVNDSLGHPAGNELLRQVSIRITGCLRESDFAGRQAGDEFVIVLPQCTNDSVTDTLERLQSVLTEPMVIAETSVTVSSSIGIAMYPVNGCDMETLIQRAEMAMYQAKTQNPGRFSFFSIEMNQLSQERLALESALRHALKNNQLHLHYQPQIELSTGRLYGVEALARWSHPELGAVPPGIFIPLAEECGMIAGLGHWVLNEACRQLAFWRNKGLLIPTVAINLSPTSFHNLDLPGLITDILQTNALHPEELTLEITENILLDTNPGTMRTIEELHKQGIRLSMDDFGTGYSSLSYLHRLPVSELKLDRSFVSDLEHDDSAQVLSAAILGLGKSLRLSVVAEGVETESQLQILRTQGYPVVQGYLFSPPLRPDDFEKWFARQSALNSTPTI